MNLIYHCLLSPVSALGPLKTIKALLLLLSLNGRCIGKDSLAVTSFTPSLIHNIT